MKATEPIYTGASDPLPKVRAPKGCSNFRAKLAVVAYALRLIFCTRVRRWADGALTLEDR